MHHVVTVLLFTFVVGFEWGEALSAVKVRFYFRSQLLYGFLCTEAKILNDLLKTFSL